MSSDPKEALERLKVEQRLIKAALIYILDDAARDQFAADLSWLIAEREGLEREVERLTGQLDNTLRLSAAIELEALRQMEGWIKERKLREAAEAKLSALQEACKPFADICVGRESFGDEVEIDIRLVSPRLNVSRARLLMKEFRALRALLPTVPVETEAQATRPPGYEHPTPPDGLASSGEPTPTDDPLPTRDELKEMGFGDLLGSPVEEAGLCEDCPPVGYITDKTRCLPCPRRDPTVPVEGS